VVRCCRINPLPVSVSNGNCSFSPAIAAAAAAADNDDDDDDDVSVVSTISTTQQVVTSAHLMTSSVTSSLWQPLLSSASWRPEVLSS